MKVVLFGTTFFLYPKAYNPDRRHPSEWAGALRLSVEQVRGGLRKFPGIKDFGGGPDLPVG
jgi:hypothetical protein